MYSTNDDIDFFVAFYKILVVIETILLTFNSQWMQNLMNMRIFNGLINRIRFLLLFVCAPPNLILTISLFSHRKVQFLCLIIRFSFAINVLFLNKE